MSDAFQPARAEARQAPQLAYETFCSFFAPRSQVHSWDDLMPIERQAWAHAIEAVREFDRRGGEL